MNDEKKVFMSRSCKNCCKEFDITWGEKEWYDAKQWMYPERCPECRKERRKNAQKK